MGAVAKVRLLMTRYSEYFFPQRHHAPAIASQTAPTSTSPRGDTVSQNVGRSTEIDHEKGQSRSSPLQPKPGKVTTFWNWLVEDSWVVEYAALILAVAAFSSIVAVLQTFKDRPASDWTSKISLNTVISTVATVMKGAVLLPVGAGLSQLKWAWYQPQRRPLRTFQTLDAASRGPLGAATLLYELKFWHLASLGAGVTLLALASDPFVQQSVTYPVRTTNETASIPFAQDYRITDQSIGVYANEPEQSMKAAIYDGIMYSNISETGAAISAQCPTGNCTFPAYASIAICSKCVNVTPKIDNVCLPINASQYPGGPDCAMQPTLPNGLELPNGEGYLLMHNGNYNFLNMSVDEDLNDDMPLSPLSFANVTMLIANVSLDHPHIDTVNMGEKLEEMLKKTMAFDCIFYFCVQTYTGQVSNGVFTETPGQQIVANDTAYPDMTDSPYAKDVDRGFHLTPDQFPTGANLTFSVSGEVSSSFFHYFSSIFTGEGTGNAESRETRVTSDIMGSLFHNGPDKIPESMRNLATSMTNNMRLRANTAVQGTASVVQPYIHVRWLWLLLPLIMILASAVFLLLTVWQSRRRGIPSWRSSALAIMVHGIHGGGGGGDDEGTSDIMAANDAVRVRKEKVSELDRWAEGVEVSLRRRGRVGLSYGLVAGNVDGYSPVPVQDELSARNRDGSRTPNSA